MRANMTRPTNLQPACKCILCAGDIFSKFKKRAGLQDVSD